MTSAQKWLLGLSTILLALSGGLYALFKYLGEALSNRLPALFPAADDAFSAVQHPWQPWALDLHILAAPLLVFAIGWVFKDHILAKLASKSAPLRASGILALAVVLPMVVSGYLLQTVTREGLHLAVVLVHAGSGTVFALAYGAHVLSAPKRNSGDGGSPPTASHRNTGRRRRSRTHHGSGRGGKTREVEANTIAR